jgi:hypothetical protein
MTTIGAVIGAEATSLITTTFTFPIPAPYQHGIEAVTTEGDILAEFVHPTRAELARHTRPPVTPHLMQAAIVPSTTQAPDHITPPMRDNWPMRGTSENQPFQIPTNFPDSKTAIRPRIGRLSLAETRSTIRRPPDAAMPSTTSHRSIQGTNRCAATAIKVMGWEVAAIMPSGAMGLADKPRSSVTGVGLVMAEAGVSEAAASEAAEEAFTAEAVEVEGVVVAGERLLTGDD